MICVEVFAHFVEGSAGHQGLHQGGHMKTKPEHLDTASRHVPGQRVNASDSFSPLPRLLAAVEGSRTIRSGPRSDQPDSDETLIADPRGHLRPAQQVERKLLSLLKHTMLPISLLRVPACDESFISE
jgi:hypothetical protein